MERQIGDKASKTFEGKLIDFRDVGGKIHIMFEDGSGCALPTKMFKDFQDGDWVEITVKVVQ